MHHFQSDDLDIAYLDEGEGDPVLLIHGFASSAKVNWIDPGWVATLTGAGYRAVAVDNRGHGKSAKPHRTEDYAIPTMAKDAERLLDHLRIPSAHLLGYSMGARISIALALAAPDRVRTLSLGGMGDGLITGMRNAEAIASAMEMGDPSAVTDEAALGFRRFADRNGSDRAALAACVRALAKGLDPDRLHHLTLPVLLALGGKDALAGSADQVLGLLPNVTFLDIPRRDHMTAVGDKVFKAGVLDFLTEHGGNPRG